MEKEDNFMIKNHQKTLNRIHVLIDLVLVVVAYVLAYGFRFLWLGWIPKFHEIPGTYLSFHVYVNYLWVILPGYFFILFNNGVYRPQRSAGRFLEILRIVKTNVMGMIYIMALLFLVKEINISRWFLVFFFLLNVSMELGYRFCLRSLLKKIRKEGYNTKKVLLIGYSRTTEGLLDRMKRNPQWGYDVIGILDDEMAVGTKYKGIAVIGNLADLDKVIKESELDEINITMKMEDYTSLAEIVAICEKSGVHTKFLPDYQDIIPTIPYKPPLMQIIHSIQNLCQKPPEDFM